MIHNILLQNVYKMQRPKGHERKTYSLGKNREKEEKKNKKN